MVYHHIIPDEYWDEKLHLTVAIKESKFRKQLSIIKRHFDYSATKIEQTIPLMITFDDGYNCSVFSSKILDEYGFNGVYFMPISNLDSQKPLWIDEILKWFSYVPYNNYQVGEENICIFSEADRLIMAANVICAHSGQEGIWITGRNYFCAVERRIVLCMMQ